MRTDQIYSSVFYSLCLHSLFVIATVIYVMYSGEHYKAAPFVVSLVDTTSKSFSSAAAQKNSDVPAPPAEGGVHTIEKTEKITPKEKSRVNDQIAALEAKKKIETLAGLRKAVRISKSGAVATEARGTMNMTATSGGNYGNIVMNKLSKCWVLPEAIDKDLLGVIDIHVSRNGSVTIDKFAKKSGNIIFDRAILRAITNCAPVPPPLTETDIEITFTP
jgi:TonB family protein